MVAKPQIDIGEYQYGFRDEEDYVFKSGKGLSRQVVEETGCGLVVNPLDPAAIAEAVRWLLENPGEAAAMGGRGRRAVEERYNWGSEGQKLVRYYERFRGRGPEASVPARGQASQNR